MTELEKKSLLHVEKLLNDVDTYNVYKKFNEIMQLHNMDSNQISIAWKELENVMASTMTSKIRESYSWIKTILTSLSK